jgi:hypothetical protein
MLSAITAAELDLQQRSLEPRGAHYSFRKTHRILKALGYVYAMSGHRAEALAILNELERNITGAKSSASIWLRPVTLWATRPGAFAWLEKDFKEHSAVATHYGMVAI